MCGNLVVGVLIQYMSHMKCAGAFSLRVDQSPKGWEAKDDGKKSEDVHV